MVRFYWIFSWPADNTNTYFSMCQIKLTYEGLVTCREQFVNWHTPTIEIKLIELVWDKNLKEKFHSLMIKLWFDNSNSLSVRNLQTDYELSCLNATIFASSYIFWEKVNAPCSFQRKLSIENAPLKAGFLANTRCWDILLLSGNNALASHVWWKYR